MRTPKILLAAAATLVCQLAVFHATESPPNIIFNLADDPSETTDVSTAHPEVVPSLEEGVILGERLSLLPGAPWKITRSDWLAKEGAVWGVETKSNTTGAHPVLAQTKGALDFLVFGDTIGFRKVMAAQH